MENLVAFLKSISPISEVTIADVKALFTYQELRKGDVFLRADEITQKFAFLDDGLLRAYYRNSAGTEYNKHFFCPPCFIGGYASLVTGQPNQIIQEALTDCKIWVVDYSKFVLLYDKHQELERMARKLAEQFFVQKEQREVEIVLLNADERYKIFKRDFPEMEQLIPQYHIASYLGITPTQLSRIRKKLRSG